MIGIQCHWLFVGDILGYPPKKFDNFCDRQFLDKLAIEVNFFGWAVDKACIYSMKGQ